MASWKETICIVLATISACLLPIFSWKVGRVIIVFMALMNLLRFIFEDIRTGTEDFHQRMEAEKRKNFEKWFYDNREK